MKELRLKIDGMSCVACSSSIERSLGRKKFIKKIEVDLINAQAFIIYDENLTDKQTIINKIEKLGYKASETKNVDSKNNKNNKYLLAIIFAIPLFIISMVSMLLDIKNELLICIIEIILLLPILYAGSQMFKRGFLSLIKLVPNMDSLIMLGSSSAILYSLYMLILYLNEKNHSLLHNVYFESAGVIIAVIMLGKKLENNATQNAKSALESLINLAPKTALKYENNTAIKTNINDIDIGEIISIPKGAFVSLDGILLSANCILDTSLITGESKKIEKQKGEVILSGSINYGEQFFLQVTAKASDSMIGKIINLMQGIKKAPIARIADIVSAYFVPIIIFVALAGAICWYLIKGDLHFSFIILTSTLLISCPCALGLATPLSILIATNKASKKAIYFKSGESLEKLGGIDVVVFDKTGTLTNGNLEVVNFIDKNIIDSRQLLSYIYAIESKSEHIISKAIIDFISSKNINKKIEAINIKTVIGSGIYGTIDNKTIKIGNARFVGLDSNIDSKYTLIFVSVDEILCGIFEISDSTRENAKELVSNLESIHIKSIILSGDTLECVQRVANQCGIESYHHSQLPSEKLDFIEKLQKENKKVAFVGDGINDALALKKADIGISLSIANDIAIKQADILLLNSNLNNIYNAILLSKKTILNIKENLAFAFIYNICTIPIALGIPYIFGLNLSLNPMIAGIAMGLSSISVVLNAMRLNKTI